MVASKPSRTAAASSLEVAPYAARRKRCAALSVSHVLGGMKPYFMTLASLLVRFSRPMKAVRCQRIVSFVETMANRADVVTVDPGSDHQSPRVRFNVRKCEHFFLVRRGECDSSRCQFDIEP